MGIVHAYDIRGVYPSEINTEVAEQLGAILPSVLWVKKVVVGRDSRIGSPELSEALIKGLIRRGIDVFDIGLCTAPQLYFASYFYGFDAGVMVTASHNPKEYNGFKLVRKKGVALSYETGLRKIEKKLENLKWKEARNLGRSIPFAIQEDYELFLEHYLTPQKELKIVIDCMHGMGSLETNVLMQNAKITLLREDPKSNFSSDPNPIKDKLSKLQETIKKKKAHFGIAFDGDADRAVFMDEKGQKIPSDITFAFLLDMFGERKERCVIDLRMSRTIEEMAAPKKIKVYRSRVGHSYVMHRMKKKNAHLGAELSGHYYFRETHYSDSAIMAAIFFINAVSKLSIPLSQALEKYAKRSLSEEINMQVQDKQAVLKALRSWKGKKDYTDGITITSEKYWFNVRPSNTEPLLRLRAEADDETTLKKVLKEVQDFIKKS